MGERIRTAKQIERRLVPRSRATVAWYAWIHARGTRRERVRPMSKQKDREEFGRS